MINDLDFTKSTRAHIKLDLFPASIYLGTAEEHEDVELGIEARLIITNDYIFAIKMGQTGPEFLIEEELVEYTMIPKVGYQIAGAERDYFIVRDGNCGCGSRLRGMRFLPGVGHVAQARPLQQ